MGLEKGECKIAEGGDRSFWRQNEPRVLFLCLGEIQSRSAPRTNGSAPFEAKFKFEGRHARADQESRPAQRW